MISPNNSTELKSFDEVQASEMKQTTEFSNIQIPHSYGNMKKICLDQYGNPKYLLGPHYPIFISAVAVCSALLIMMIVSYYQKMSGIWTALLILSAIIFIGSYVRIGFSLPGIAHATRLPTLQERESPRFCPRCQIVRQRRTQHCGDCDVCIIELDHHCPWVGKCVGRDNLCQFYFFLCATFGTMIFCFLATAVGSVMNAGPVNLKTNPVQQ